MAHQVAKRMYRLCCGCRASQPNPAASHSWCLLTRHGGGGHLQAAQLRVHPLSLQNKKSRHLVGKCGKRQSGVRCGKGSMTACGGNRLWGRQGAATMQPRPESIQAQPHNTPLT